MLFNVTIQFADCPDNEDGDEKEFSQIVICPTSADAVLATLAQLTALFNALSIDAISVELLDATFDGDEEGSSDEENDEEDDEVYGDPRPQPRRKAIKKKMTRK